MEIDSIIIMKGGRVKLTKKIIKEILTKEIDWTFEHPAENLSRDFQKGFRSGLKQAINILIKAIDLKEGGEKYGK